MSKDRKFDILNFMQDPISMPEPLRITDTGKYELYDYTSARSIAITGALILGNLENNLGSTIKILNKENNTEFDRFMLAAFRNPSEPEKDRLEIMGKFFDPKKHFLRIESNHSSNELHFLLFFSGKEKV
jgi:hypothetical protein